MTKESSKVGRVSISLDYTEYTLFEKAAKEEYRTPTQLLKALALDFLEKKVGKNNL